VNPEPPRPPLSFPAPRASGREGLCPHCAHVRVITSAKGSHFYLCERSKDDPRFKRYPPQPRMECAGFER
jgi:hypothetical protein